MLTPCPGAAGFQLPDPGPWGSPEVRSSPQGSWGPHDRLSTDITMTLFYKTKFRSFFFYFLFFFDPSFFSANTEAGRLVCVHSHGHLCSTNQKAQTDSDLVKQTERLHALYLPEHIKNMWAHGESKAMSEEPGNKWPNTPRPRKSSKTSLTWTP